MSSLSTRRARLVRGSALSFLVLVLACASPREPHDDLAGTVRPGPARPTPVAAAGGGGAGGAPPSLGLGEGGDAGDGPAGGAPASAGEGGAPGPTPLGGAAGAEGSGCGERLLGDPVVEHACLHVEHGPYLEVSASSTVGDAPAVNEPHTAYRVAASGGDASWLSFTPNRSGAYAFLGALPTSLGFSLPGGSPIPTIEATTPCAGLPSARVLELEVAVPVNVSWTRGNWVLVVEALAPFGDQAWAPGCECREAGAACSSSADCCSLRCAGGRCEAPSSSPCGGKKEQGEACGSAESCCSGRCLDSRCAAPLCRSSGPCVSDEECCLFCHDQDHCH